MLKTKRIELPTPVSLVQKDQRSFGMERDAPWWVITFAESEPKDPKGIGHRVLEAHELWRAIEGFAKDGKPLNVRGFPAHSEPEADRIVAELRNRADPHLSKRDLMSELLGISD